MLATRGQTPPPGREWLHEIKWDGIRALVAVQNGIIRVTSRSERDITVSYPELAHLASLPDGLLIDGEIVAESDSATLFAFDLLACEGQSLIDLPLVDRRRLLEALPFGTVSRAQVSPAFDDGAALLQAARDQGLEGIISKRRASLYYPGRRSNDWVKMPLNERESFIIAGYRYQIGGGRIGSLVLAESVGDRWVYRGRVGLAVPAKTERMIADLLAGASAASAPFDEVPKEEASDVHWVRPQHIVDVEFLARTPDGRLRHPTYRGLRTDLSPADLATGGESPA